MGQTVWSSKMEHTAQGVLYRAYVYLYLLYLASLIGFLLLTATLSAGRHSPFGFRYCRTFRRHGTCIASYRGFPGWVTVSAIPVSLIAFRGILRWRGHGCSCHVIVTLVWGYNGNAGGSTI